MNRWLSCGGCVLAVLTIAELATGQSGRRGRFNSYANDRNGVPSWELHPTMPKDVFTFARVQYTSSGRGRRWGGGWETDRPDADLNLSYRLNEMTAMKVDPEGTVVRLTDSNLQDYPFIYIVEPGQLVFSDDEVDALRRYLLSGGFLMVDDFWGDYEWQNFEREINRVCFDHPIEDLKSDHEIFNIIFKLPPSPQIPNVAQGWRSQYDGVTWEEDKGPGARIPHYRGIFDDNGRLMVVICHNTDLGDGWEREGDNEYYFREFSEKIAYPLGINILFYAMTH